jgi:squalene-hopene/tetraprenyl-beta-curcumene cyclase
MRIPLKSILLIFLALSLPGIVFPQKVKVRQAETSLVDESLKNEIRHAIYQGLKWLNTQQKPDGSWEGYPAITGLVLSSYLRSPFELKSWDSLPAKGFVFLQQFIHPDGSIFGKELANYNTAICLRAFKDARDAKYNDLIMKAEKYLIGDQFDESRSYTRDSLNFGGVGYGNGKKADLSNLVWAIEALQKETRPEIEKKPSDEEKQHEKQKDLFYEKASLFLSRCQNLKSTNPAEWAADDGGFMYGPGISKAKGTSSYGSMTYAGMLSMIYARLDREDPRVKAAFAWVSKNYSVETNPVLGTDGLFYYYQTMAKALNSFGQEKINTPDGQVHNWRSDLALQLIRIQNTEGWWVNSNGRWRENIKVLTSAYCILSLEEILGH